MRRALTAGALGTATLTIVLALSATTAVAQVKQQVFVGAGVTVPRHAGASSTSISGGYSLLIPVAPGWLVRPLISVARVDPTTPGRPAFPSVLAGGFIIRRVTPTFSLLAGGGMNTLFPRSAPAQRLGVVLLSTNSRINDRWVMLTPVVISRTGLGVNMHFAFAW